VAHEPQDDSFKVIDRRLFNAQGELRKEALEDEARSDSEPPPQPPAAEARSSAANAPAAAPPAVEAPEPAPAFRRLVESLAQNATMLLGGYADPRTGQAILDLEGARELIDMLDALREKTRGNLAPEEDRFLLDVLGSLKLSFLEMSKAAAAAMREKAAGKP